MYRWISVCVAPLCLSLVWYFPFIWCLFYLLCLSLFIVIAVFALTLWGHVALSSPHQTSLFLLDKVEKDVRQIEETLKEDQSNWPHTTKKTHLPVIFGRTVDSQLQLLIDYVLRDFVARWLKELSHKPEPVIDKFKEHVWGAVQNLYERLLRVDAEKLLASDMVTKITQHFERIRIARSCAIELNQPPVFALAPHLMSYDTELHYLRQISELIIMFLMPRCYSLAPATHLMREILACKVLQPAIDLVTEPDYINQKIIQYLEAQKEVDAMHVRTHEYAKTFEDYIRLINSCNNVDTLKRLRYDIVTQIMQATTLQNVKRAKGVDIEVIEKSGSQNVSRQQIADAKKLKRYINQLTIAKAECETALRKLGWDGAFPTVESDSKTLPLHKIMESVTGRRYLSMFLETMCSQGLVGFWMAVEELRHSPRSSWHQLGAEIFYTYIRSPSAEIKVDKDTRKRMEAFLLGDKGPEVFYEVQDTVVDTIQEKYYHSFLLSDHYTALIAELATEEANKGKDITSDRSPIEDRQLSNESVSSAESVAGTIHLTEHSTYARRKLDELQERHNNKIQALAALRASLKPESPALAMLANEVEKLAGEQMRLEAHLARTDTWAEHLGRWRASVHSAEIIDESKPPQFVIVVHMAEQESMTDEERPEQITTGWVLLRTLNEFQELHRKLRPMCAELKNLELPTNSFKFLFGKNDKNSLEKAKILIQKYLEFVLEDDRLNQSEALYTFLNPSSEYLKQGDLPKKNKFSFSTLFKSTSSEATNRSSQEKEQFTHLSADEDEISLYLDGNGSDNNSKSMTSSLRGAGAIAEERDSIAEPLYALLSEVFDMRGVFRWLRKTLVTFVQITYGRTINRQIKETVTWLFSEQMLHYYISVVLKSWWPGGTLSENTSNRNFQDKEHTCTLARQQLSESVVDALASLVGAQAAARGAHKLFYTLQNTTHNKQLFYELFELVLLEVFPELKRYQ
ncbi:sorting nexin-25 isoform X1 [Spodoptera frugiperda]|uniref:Sorting nexin-25 isoform X1 n=1 Tax=Spodoptera frugiperda TaxID=7108 RepID=A0A9R0CWC3_SPOFR|nr:sorting nexin-25 isoform X1 [Spodoptera frugiperda]